MAGAFKAYFRCDPWDLVDEGIDAVLDRLAGEVGVDGLVVSVLTGSVCVFRAHDGVSPRTFRCPPAAHFQPASKCYASSRLRPPTAGWIKSGNPLERVAAACEKRGLALSEHVVACDNATIVDRHGFAACEDAFGDASPARLCPTNPDVRAYLCGLVEDLSTNYAIEAVILIEADFGRPAGFHPGRLNPARSGWESSVMCFCPSCRQAAAEQDVEAGPIAHHAAALASAADGEVGDADVSAYRRFRSSVVAATVKAIRRHCQCALDVHFPDLDPHRGVSVEHIAEFVSGWWAPESCETTRQALADAIGSRARIGVCAVVGAGRELPGASADVVRNTSDLVVAGHRNVVFESYGATPLDRLEWVRQAIRFARREAGGV